MASGIPCVASPVGINARIVVSGKNGFLADSTDQWVEHIRTLAENTDLREQLGAEGRKCAEEKYAMKLASKTLKNWVDELTRK